MDKDRYLLSLCRHLSDGLFSAHPSRRVRSSMAFLAVLLMLGSCGVVLWLGYAGYGYLPAIQWWCVISLSGLVVMTGLVRFGVTSMWRDPSLTFPQVLWAVTSSAVAYVLVGEAKGIVPGVLAVSLLFAALNLKAKQIVTVSFYALGVFALAMLLDIKLGKGGQATAMDVAYAAVLLIMLMGCMLLSLRLYQLRVRLRKQRQELAMALEENRELASRDELTGLLNRRHMLELLHLEQRRCMRGPRTMLLAQMDIDHFKSINDTYGHLMGDLALKTFADLVRTSIRNTDVFSRWGGEEFVLLLSDTSVEGAMLTLNRIRQTVQNAEVRSEKGRLRMTVSIGLAEYLPGETIETTLDRADKALYSAKRSGRNQVVLGENPVAVSAGAEIAQMA